MITSSSRHNYRPFSAIEQFRRSEIPDELSNEEDVVYAISLTTTKKYGQRPIRTDRLSLQLRVGVDVVVSETWSEDKSLEVPVTTKNCSV